MATKDHYQPSRENRDRYQLSEREARPYYAGGGAPQQYGNNSQEAQPLDFPGNERQWRSEVRRRGEEPSGARQERREGRQSLNPNPGYPLNQVSNQKPFTTMRSEDRNYGEDYNYRNQRYENDINRGEDRAYGSRRGMSGQYYDRDYDRGGFDRERPYGRGSYGQQPDYNRGGRQGRNRDFEGGRDEGRYEQRNYGRFHSTETDVPGRGYESEREMNRHANNYIRGNEPDMRGSEWDRRREGRYRPYQEEPYYGAASSHSATGPYEDVERDKDRYGIRQDYHDGTPTYEPADYDRTRDYQREGYRDRNRSLYYRRGEEAERRRRLANRIQDRGLERSPSGNWGPSENEYNRRSEGYRERY